MQIFSKNLILYKFELFLQRNNLGRDVGQNGSFYDDGWKLHFGSKHI